MAQVKVGRPKPRAGRHSLKRAARLCIVKTLKAQKRYACRLGAKVMSGRWRESAAAVWRGQNLEEEKRTRGAGKLVAKPYKFDNGLFNRAKP